MSLFQCENCGCCENTALSAQGTIYCKDLFDWEGIEELKGKKLCSACAPAKYKDGGDSKLGKWHDRFERVHLPKGKFKTNQEGNLEHIETGSTDFMKYSKNSHQG